VRESCCPMLESLAQQLVLGQAGALWCAMRGQEYALEGRPQNLGGNGLNPHVPAS
jgi:hypothetical protein